MITGLGQFWQKLRHSTESRVAERTEWLASGRIKDYVEYREAVAYIQALYWVLDEAAVIFGDAPTPRKPPTEDDD